MIQFTHHSLRVRPGPSVAITAALQDNTVGLGELARASLSFKRPTSRRRRTPTVTIIGNFHMSVALCHSSKQNELILKKMIYAIR